MAGPAAVPGVDPSRVSTPEELAACLNGLRRRRGLSYEAIEKAAAKLSARSGGWRLEPLAKSTVGEIVTGKRLPGKDKLLTFLAVCEVAPADRAQWLTAWERARTADLARPAGGVRVRLPRDRDQRRPQSASQPAGGVRLLLGAIESGGAAYLPGPFDLPRRLQP